MTDRSDLVVKGNDAQRLLEDPTLQAAWEFIEKDIVEKLAGLSLSNPEEDEMAVEQIRHLQINRLLKKKLWDLVSHGKMEESRSASSQLKRVNDPRHR